MIKKLILSTLLLCGLANAAPSSTLDAVLERGVLRVGFDAGYQPFEMTNKQGQYMVTNQEGRVLKRGHELAFRDITIVLPRLFDLVAEIGKKRFPDNDTRTWNAQLAERAAIGRRFSSVSSFGRRFSSASVFT